MQEGENKASKIPQHVREREKERGREKESERQREREKNSGIEPPASRQKQVRFFHQLSE